jgi:predicted RNA-binding protein YlxR (DUF448 family)
MARKQPAGRRKRAPQRTCVVCGQTMDKRALIRLVVDPAAGVVVDPTGKRNGRGAYLCAEDICWEKALKTDVLDRALRTPLTADDRVRLRDSRPQ